MTFNEELIKSYIYIGFYLLIKNEYNINCI